MYYMTMCVSMLQTFSMCYAYMSKKSKETIFHCCLYVPLYILSILSALYMEFKVFLGGGVGIENQSDAQ